MKRRATALLVLFACIQAPVAAGDGGVSFVLSNTGPDGDYAVRHAGRAIVIHAGLKLVTGDCITILRRTNADPVDNENRVVVIVDGRRMTLRKAQTPYCVPRPAGPIPRAVSVVAQLVADFAQYFTVAEHDYNSEQTEPVIHRGNGVPLSIPLLRRGSAKLAAGQRSFAIGWVGGAAPFEVALYRGDGSPRIAMLRSGDARRARFLTTAFTPGDYSVEVIDADGNRDRRDFAVVREIDVPQLAPHIQAALRSSTTPPDLRAAIEAAHLATTSDEWKLEAYQRISNLAKTSDLAGALSFELAAGG
jgi:hypothetical protein